METPPAFPAFGDLGIPDLPAPLDGGRPFFSSVLTASSARATGLSGPGGFWYR
jgi:hypothetical protein